MELPSMVQRSGDRLIVRSVVSGNQLYMDQTANSANSNNNNNNSNTTNNNNNNILNNNNQHHNNNNNNNNHHLKGIISPKHLQQLTNSNSNNNNNSSTNNLNASALEMFRNMTAVHQQQQQQYAQQQQQKHQHQQHQQQLQQHQQQQQQQQQQHNATQQAAQTAAVAAAAAAAAMELKDEGLPQCKIKRNYSCSYCTYFTQNPRSHLTHLRDVHGEKIVINKCELCLYASRHFQKLVRHMKMVHGCTDGITSGHGQARGKRGMSREARKRKLEQSVGLGLNTGGLPTLVGACGRVERPTLEQVKRELELQEQKQKQQQAAEAMFKAAYERQLLAQREHERERERELEALQAARQQQQAYEQDVMTISGELDAEPQPSPSGGSQHNPTPSPAGSTSPLQIGDTPNSSSNASAALSLTFADEPAQNRLLKCSVCDFTTLYRAQLVSHESEEHYKTKFFRCEKCSYVTHIKTRFSKHVKYHSMPMIKCVTCDFRTPYKWNLDRHMKNHGGAGPFKCAACDFTADIKQSLTVHEMNHHVPPVGHAAGMSLARRRNKVGGTDLCDDFLSDPAEMLDDHYNNNNLDDYDEAMLGVEESSGGADVVLYGKKSKYDDDEPTDLSQKGGSSDTSSVHNHQSVNGQTPKAKRPMPNLIPISKPANSVLNLSKDLAASRHSLGEIASIFFTDNQLSEMLKPLDKSDAAQLSPTTTITSNSSQNSRSLLQHKALGAGGSFFDKLNLICTCGHMAKCLSESIIHRKTCNFDSIPEDDIEEEQDDGDGRLEIDFADEEDRQSHSALNLSVTGSTRCQHCRHRCKSSADLLNHLKQCSEATLRCGNESSYDSSESCTGRGGGTGAGTSIDTSMHPMENRVFIWNNMARGSNAGATNQNGTSVADVTNQREVAGTRNSGEGTTSGTGGANSTSDDNSYYGVETAPGYGEVTKKMTPEEEAANSSLKKVYKCPHCSFWASTASRFHVHIVGHLNKKPFECSLCSYRSNWRWDITKHIRLKTIRDPSHKNARVLMNDETGRRNYTKYNKYITLMKVTEEDGDPKLLKSGEMTPNQVASLAFINDFTKSAPPLNGLSVSVSGTNPSSSHLNGIKEDITLEPVLTTKAAANAAGALDSTDGVISPNNYIHVPMISSLINAMTITQQHQQQQQQRELDHATLITPSVTISAVKRSPPHLLKPSDDLVTDFKQEGNEKRTFYKCRRCSFKHGNRDAVLAHVRVHYQDSNSNYPSPGAGNSSKTSTPASTAAVAPNLQYMNKMLALCLSQQQLNSNNSNNNGNANNNQSTIPILSTGLLQQAMQQSNTVASNISNKDNNGTLSGLALALTGKSPSKASILEHGEQKAIQNEASAPQKQQEHSSTTASSSASSFGLNCGDGGNGGAGAGATGGGSLQLLLTSPRSHHAQQQQQQQQQTPSNTGATGVGGATTTPSNYNNKHNLVMGPTGINSSNNNNASNGGGGNNQFGIIGDVSITTLPRNTTSSTNPISSLVSFGGSCSMQASTSSSSSSSPSQQQQRSRQRNDDNAVGGSDNGGADGGGDGDGSGGVNKMLSLLNTDSIYISGVHLGSNAFNSTTTSTLTTSSTITTNSNHGVGQQQQQQRHHHHHNQQQPNQQQHSSSSSISLQQTAAATGTTTITPTMVNASAMASLSSPSCASSLSSSSCPSSFSSSSPPLNSSLLNAINSNNNNLNSHTNNQNIFSNSNSMLTQNNINKNHHTNNNNNNSSSNGNNLLSHNDSERRDPSPYRCGHCHQVSNWKHVIQRHCRLKHASDIRIETLDRSALSDRNGAPIYRPIGNGATNESHQGGNLTFKALQDQHRQQQQQQQHQQLKMNLGNNNNSVLINKAADKLLHSPLATAGGDLQTFLAAYKATTGATLNGISAEDLLQLQHNDQIEITRLPPTANCNNLAQLLESANNNNISSNNNNNNNAGQNSSSGTQQQQQQQNSKCKQQKCPLCPYISESKSQMNYHISLHKPTQYECPLCTFVCAKKQHLSSHMRSVHQQALGSGSAATSAAAAAGSLSLDFSMALQLAAAAQAQQDNNAFAAPLAIDLSAALSLNPVVSPKLPSSRNAAVNSASSAAIGGAGGNTAAEQPLCIAYCPKCPAHFGQRAKNEARAELKEHLKAHAESPDAAAYKCEFCDYRAAHETLVHSHRHVHTQQYQDKQRHCPEDGEYPAPKLMQLTLTKNLPAPEVIWVIDNELQQRQRQQQQQHANITSSSTGGGAAGSFDSANSLLKKQLEAGPAPRNSPSPPAARPEAERDDSSSHTAPSTSASVATSDLAGSDSISNAASPAPLERCQHCPYETSSATLYKSHLQHHIAVAGQKLAHTCDHCDYTDADGHKIEEHTRVHFNAMEKLKSVAFFTSYDHLELSVKHDDDDDTVRTHKREEESHVEQPEPMDVELDVERRMGGEGVPRPHSAASDSEATTIKREQIDQQHELAHEHNNNNEENAINENTVHEQQQQQEKLHGKENEQMADDAGAGVSIDTEAAAAEHAAKEGGDPLKQTCTKIILYKSDGCLSIKKDHHHQLSSNNNSNSNGGSGDNISDRLRRRISRSAHALSGIVGDEMPQQQQQHPQQQQQQAEHKREQSSHKTILVNAKTGQVISRN